MVAVIISAILSRDEHSDSKIFATGPGGFYRKYRLSSVVADARTSEEQSSRSSQRNFFSTRLFPRVFRTYCQFHCQCLLLVDSVISGCHSACSYFPSRSPPAPARSAFLATVAATTAVAVASASSFRCNGAEKQIITTL